MDLNIPGFVAATIGTFIMGFGIAKGIYRDDPQRPQTEDEMMDTYYESARGRT